MGSLLTETKVESGDISKKSGTSVNLTVDSGLGFRVTGCRGSGDSQRVHEIVLELRETWF